MNNSEKINLLAQKLIVLQQQLEKNRSEIDLLRNEIELLKKSEENEFSNADLSLKKEELLVNENQEQKNTIETIVETKAETSIPEVKPAKQFNLEAYLGGKIVHIVGTIVLVIGIFIGVKYAIEKDLINELTRTILGYVSGIVMLGFAFRLRNKFSVFASVLLSGAISVMFFTTYIGHSFYNLFPNAAIPFAIMVFLTAFMVFSAHVFNYQTMAFIGLIGAYAVPVLLSDGSGRIEIMFSYMAILNIGILFTGIWKNWSWLRYCTYFLTWLIYSIWFGSSYEFIRYFVPAFWFAFASFITFSLSGILYKLRNNESFNVGDIILMLGNNFLFFGFGYAILNQNYHQHLLGAFCLMVSLVNGVLAYFAFRKNQSDYSVFLLLLTLCISFATLAIPVQLNGHWVTSIWFIEAFVLFTIGRLFKQNYYQILAFAASVLGFFSLCHDWSENSIYYYDKVTLPTPFSNPVFLSGIIGSVSLTVIVWQVIKSNISIERSFKDFLIWAFPVLLIIVSYFTFYNEIGTAMNVYMEKTSLKSNSNNNEQIFYNYSLNDYETLFKFIYHSIYVAVFILISNKISMSKVVSWIQFGLLILSLCLIYEQGLWACGNLRDSYFNSFGDESQTLFRSEWLLHIRYFLFPCLFILHYLLFRTVIKLDVPFLHKIFPWINHLGILILLSNELSHLMIINHPEDIERYERISYRMGYTILWAVYSMALIVYGFWKKKKTERMLAFAIFGITLCKLVINAFSMSRGYQLIVFISVGIILIVVGYLYQRYKNLILHNDE